MPQYGNGNPPPFPGQSSGSSLAYHPAVPPQAQPRGDPVEDYAPPPGPPPGYIMSQSPYTGYSSGSPASTTNRPPLPPRPNVSSPLETSHQSQQPQPSSHHQSPWVPNPALNSIASVSHQQPSIVPQYAGAPPPPPMSTGEHGAVHNPYPPGVQHQETQRTVVSSPTQSEPHLTATSTSSLPMQDALSIANRGSLSQPSRLEATPSQLTSLPSSQPTGPLESRLESLSIGHRPSPPQAAIQQVSTLAPQQTHHQPASQPTGSLTPTTRPPAVTTCIDFDATFATTWYWHPQSPDFTICSRCYLDHIHDTIFARQFQSALLDDGRSRICFFSPPRMKKVLFKEAVTTGTLRAVIDYMRLRPTIQKCQGFSGIKGGLGHRWYRPRVAQDIPDFFACQACYEELIVGTRLSSQFELCPGNVQSEKDTWSCDMAIPYVRKTYEAKAKDGDWSGFAAEAKARISFTPCPGIKKSRTYGLSWFVPKNGAGGLALCPACYCDQVLWTDDDDKWREATELKSRRDLEAVCSFSRFNLKLSMARAQELEDYSVFWRAVEKLGNAQVCGRGGIKNGEWYTTKSLPDEFGMCRECYITIAEPLNIGHFFIPRIDVPREETLLCSLNPASARFGHMLSKLLESYITLDPSSLDSYASVWARIPLCPRDQDFTDKWWYGWRGCTICPECYQNFAHNFPSMASGMNLRNTKLPGSTLCEMYTPRMRELYRECASSQHPDLTPLFDACSHRRMVYAQTVPQIRMIISQQKMNLSQQSMLNTMGTFHTMKGQLDQIAYGNGPYTYGASGVGYGYANMDLLQGASYNQQGMGMVAGAASATMQVDMLEKRWRAVE